MALQTGQKVILILLIACVPVAIIWMAHDNLKGNANWPLLVALGAASTFGFFRTQRRLKAKIPSGDTVGNASPPKSN